MPFECETINLDVTAPATPEAKLWDGWGTALKPAWEPIIVAMKPIEGTYANNALIHGVAGLNVDGGRVEGNKPSVPQAAGGTGKVYGFKNGKGRSGIMSDNTKGRWPANLIHDGSEEVVGLFPVTGASKAVRRNQVARTAKSKEAEKARTGMLGHNDNGGSAARFFYQAKATKKDRGEGNTHPTVKPSSLMDYLCRLTATPTGGVVLDPFAGSGSTGVACVRTGRDFIGCEIDSDYCEIAKGRLGI
jgi:site-specific DNA-methyltransferase (adenine-specific)